MDSNEELNLELLEIVESNIVEVFACKQGTCNGKSRNPLPNIPMDPEEFDNYILIPKIAG